MQIWDESKSASPVNREGNKPFMTHYVCAARRLQAHSRSHAAPGARHQTGSCTAILFTPPPQTEGETFMGLLVGF